MILFPNAKINLGLYVTARRPDGYHDLNTVMVPVGWCDVLEIVPTKADAPTLTVYGRGVDCAPENNLVMKAYRALSDFTGGLPAVDFHLEKIIPDGAGLGGGSADAAFAIRGLNELFNLGLPSEILARVASGIGADCAFFIHNTPSLCQGIGDRITAGIATSLAGRKILIAKPRVASVSTKEAYAGITPQPSDIDLMAQVAQPPAAWTFSNDFEKTVFPKAPAIEALKRQMLADGAEYAAMSGSGAAVFGIFESDRMAQKAYDNLSECDKTVTTLI